MGAELFYADGQTDMTMLIVAFRNSDKAPEKGKDLRSNSNVPYCDSTCHLIPYPVHELLYKVVQI